MINHLIQIEPSDVVNVITEQVMCYRQDVVHTRQLMQTIYAVFGSDRQAISEVSFSNCQKRLTRFKTIFPLYLLAIADYR